MNGFVDDDLRALIDVTVSSADSALPQSLQVWIDTAFNGGLVIPRTQITSLGLKRASCTEAVLADGQIVELDTFSCFIHWFGKIYRTQVVANDGSFPLLGTLLLSKRKLLIDYEAATLSLT